MYVHIYIEREKFTGYRLCRRPLGLRVGIRLGCLQLRTLKKILDQICSILPWLLEAGWARTLAA